MILHTDTRNRTRFGSGQAIIWTLLFALSVVACLLLPATVGPMMKLERHEGSDSANFDNLRREILDGDRRNDDAQRELGKRLTIHGEQLAAVTVRLGIVEEWQKEAGSRLWQTFIGVILACIASVIAAINTHLTRRSVETREEKTEVQDERRHARGED